MTPTDLATARELRDSMRELLASTAQNDPQYLAIADETRRATGHYRAVRAALREKE